MTENTEDLKNGKGPGRRTRFFSALKANNLAASVPKVRDTAEESEAKKIAAQNLKAAARSYSGEALETLVEIMRNRGANPQTRIAAANSILDRGHGKSVNQTEISVGVYDRWSNEDLIRFIAGETVLDGEVLTPRQDSPVLDYDGDDAGDE